MPSNLLQRGATWLGERLQAAAGRSVTYKRGGQAIPDITGWPAKNEYEVTDDEGLPEKVWFYDWSFTASDLNFANDETLFEARPGDQITETINGRDIVYEVAPPGKRPVAEWLDSAGVILLVHTKIVSQEPTP